MAEGLDGKLTFNKKGQRFLQFTTPKGGQMSLVASPDVLTPPSDIIGTSYFLPTCAQSITAVS